MPQETASFKRCPDCRRMFLNIADKSTANKMYRVKRTNKTVRQTFTCPNCGKNNVKDYMAAIPGRFNEKGGMKWINPAANDVNFKDPDEKETELTFEP